MENNDFRSNLRLLCSYERSVAEVCRSLDLNRQQFNKYLAGSIFPSRRNLRRICDFFGVTDSEIFLPHSHFAEIITLKPRNRTTTQSSSPEAQTLQRLRANSHAVPDRYLGYYYRYFYSFAFSGYVTKSLVHIFRNDGLVYWKNIELLRRHDRREKTQATFKYLGLVTLIAERVFVFEEEMVLKNSVTQSILYPSYTSRVRQLVGIQTSASNLAGRNPSASRVVLEFLAPNVDVRSALRSCGQFRESEISPDIQARIANKISKRATVLAAWIDR